MTRFDHAVLRLLGATTYPLTVRGVRDVTPHHRRIRFGAPELLAAHETPPAFWLRLWIPADGDVYQRAFTVTDVRAEEASFASDFALHDGPGLASAWARSAAPGDRLDATVYTGKDGALPPPSAPGCLFVGDPASLAAVNDLVAALPEDVPAHVILGRQHAEDAELPVHTRATDQVTWVPHGLEHFTAAVTEPRTELVGWHAWIATESGITRRLRTLLREDYGLARSAVSAQGYWTYGRPMGRTPRNRPAAEG